ncbi:MAG: hypothetical protein GY940_10755 [bacterium]|nr:hypothetical protein [bacterium]
MESQTNDSTNDKTKPIKKPSWLKALIHAVIAVVVMMIAVVLYSTTLPTPRATQFSEKMGHAAFYLFIAVLLFSYIGQKFRFEKTQKKG